MKKFMKISLIAAVVLVVFGTVLAGIGFLGGGQEKLDQMTRGLMHQGENDADFDGDWTEEMDFDRDFPILKGDFQEEMELPILRGLELEAGGVSMRVADSGQPVIRLETDGIDKAQFYVEEGTLHVKVYKRYNMDVNNTDLGSATLYLPSNVEFAETELEIGAGELTIEVLQTEELEGKVGAGQIFVEELNAGRAELAVGMGQMNIQNAVVRGLEFEIGMGTLLFQGMIDGDIDGECGMGNVQMDIDGRFEAYNYKIESAMGTVKIGDQEFSGLASDQYITNDASRNCHLSSAMGSMKISFTE